MAISNLVMIESMEDVTILSFGSAATSIQGHLPDEIAPILIEATECPAPHLLVDLEQVEFFNSSFIELLVRGWNRMNKREGGRFALCNVHPYCQEVLDVTNLSMLWKIFPSREAALEDLNSSKPA